MQRRLAALRGRGGVDGGAVCRRFDFLRTHSGDARAHRIVAGDTASLVADATALIDPTTRITPERRRRRARLLDPVRVRRSIFVAVPLQLENARARRMAVGAERSRPRGNGRRSRRHHGRRGHRGSRRCGRHRSHRRPDLDHRRGRRAAAGEQTHHREAHHSIVHAPSSIDTAARRRSAMRSVMPNDFIMTHPRMVHDRADNRTLDIHSRPPTYIHNAVPSRPSTMTPSAE